MIQQTSFEAFLQLNESGTLGAKQYQVYKAIESLGVASNLDIAYELQ